jgi:hypothetical protein
VCCLWPTDDDDAIVDVVTVSSGETFSMTDTRSYLPLINAFHNYCASPNTAAVHKQARDPSSETKFKLVWSPERRSSALPSSAATCSSTSRLFMASGASSTRCSSSKSRPSSSSASVSSSIRGASSNRRVGIHVRKAGSNKASDEQRSKREALNDLERQRRREMTREITSLRVVVPGVRDNPRAAKVTILNSASTHIRALERTFERNRALLAAEMQKMAQFKSRLAASYTQ